MPTVIFVNSAVSILYHCGLMQAVIQKLAVVMHYTMGTSAAETLCTASSIFLGQVPVTVVLYPPVMNKYSFKTSYMKRDAFFDSKHRPKTLNRQYHEYVRIRETHSLRKKNVQR